MVNYVTLSIFNNMNCSSFHCFPENIASENIADYNICVI